MKKTTVKFLIALSALLGSLVLGACSEASIEELDDKVAEALKNGTPDKIKKYAEKACEKNSVYGCHTLGGFYEAMADYRNAIVYLEKSCKNRDSVECKKYCDRNPFMYFYSDPKKIIPVLR